MQRVLLALLLVACGAGLPVQAKLYKWVDENGQVHYGDSVPAQYLNKEHKEINEQGVAVKRFDAAETPEERAERKRMELVKKREEQRLAEQRQRDRVLLDTYTTERDLVAARDARLEAVDSQIQLSDSLIEDSKKKVDSSEKLVESLKAQGKPVPDTLLQKINREQKQLQTQKEVRRGHEQKRESIDTQFSDYILRFRELKAEQHHRREQIEARRNLEQTAVPATY